MMTEGEKIKAIRTALALTQQAFGKPISISKGHLSNVEKGKDNLSASAISLLKIHYSINPTWWESGEGDIFALKQEGFPLSKDYRQLSPARTMLEDLLDQESEEELKELVFKLLEKQRGVKGGN